MPQEGAGAGRCVRTAAKPRAQCQGHFTVTEGRKKDLD